MSIRTKDMVSQVYSNESRDFQLLTHLYDAVFNYMKMSIDNMADEPISKNSNPNFIDLAIKTLGFESKHNYNINNLQALGESFKKIMFNKGTIKAIEDTISTLLRAQNMTEEFNVSVMTNKVIRIDVPRRLDDVALIDNMMDYILPAGFVYEIYTQSIDQLGTEVTFTTKDEITKVTGTDRELSRLVSYAGLSTVVGDEILGEEQELSGQEFIDDALEEEEDE